MTAMVTRAAATIDPYITNEGIKVVIAWGGTNDIIFNHGLSAAGLYASFTTYIQGRQAAGAKVVALTMLPRQTAKDFDETKRQAFNALVVANSAGADAVADVAADSRIGDDGDQNDVTYYSGDTIHLANAGYAIVAGIVKAALGTIGY